jgi:hypothetical protein
MSEKSVWDKAKDVAADAANMAKDAAVPASSLVAEKGSRVSSPTDQTVPYLSTSRTRMTQEAWI